MVGIVSKGKKRDTPTIRKQIYKAVFDRRKLNQTQREELIERTTT